MRAMKKIGLLGGMSWESTAVYYRLLNTFVRERLGRLHSAQVVLYSVDFEEIEQLQHAGQWDSLREMMLAGARCVESAGAGCLLICSNTMHRVADAVSTELSVPLIHIADSTAQAVRAQGIDRIGLLGTRFTMEQKFYRGRLESQHGLTVITPDESERAVVHRIIYDELCLGEVRQASRESYKQIIAGLEDRGAQAIVLGCTEIGMLVKSADVAIPIFDTTALHAQAAVEWYLH